MRQTALITGASSGFGEAIARRLAKAGWRMILAARRRERLLALAAELAPAETHVLTLDVRDRQAVMATLQALPAEWRTVDLLVNNAGLALGLEPAYEASLDDWDTMIDTNIKGLTYVTRAILPGMVERRHGLIVNMGSVAGSWPYPGGNAYGASKAFVEQFSHNLRADLHGTGVRVSYLAPGQATESEFSLTRFHGDQARAENVYRGTQSLTSGDIAEIVYWLASQPAHINIGFIEVTPTCQSLAGLRVAREHSDQK